MAVTRNGTPKADSPYIKRFDVDSFFAPQLCASIDWLDFDIRAEEAMKDADK